MIANRKSYYQYSTYEEYPPPFRWPHSSPSLPSLLWHYDYREENSIPSYSPSGFDVIINRLHQSYNYSSLRDISSNQLIFTRLYQSTFFPYQEFSPIKTTPLKSMMSLEKLLLIFPRISIDNLLWRLWVYTYSTQRDKRAKSCACPISFNNDVIFYYYRVRMIDIFNNRIHLIKTYCRQIRTNNCCTYYWYYFKWS